jgi:hypothetical protein
MFLNVSLHNLGVALLELSPILGKYSAIYFVVVFGDSQEQNVRRFP